MNYKGRYKTYRQIIQFNVKKLATQFKNRQKT